MSRYVIFVAKLCAILRRVVRVVSLYIVGAHARTRQTQVIGVYVCVSAGLTDFSLKRDMLTICRVNLNLNHDVWILPDRHTSCIYLSQKRFYTPSLSSENKIILHWWLKNRTWPRPRKPQELQTISWFILVNNNLYTWEVHLVAMYKVTVYRSKVTDQTKIDPHK